MIGLSTRRFFASLLALGLLAPTLRAQEPPKELPKELTMAVQAHNAQMGDHAAPAFKYALTDLDGDGHPDAIVLLQSSTWCGSGGCTMLIFRGAADRFTFVSRSTLVGLPIRVSPETTHDWKTLIVYTKGEGDVVMRFDGKQYPPNPSKERAATASQIAGAKTVLAREAVR